MMSKLTNALRALGPDLGLLVMRVGFGGFMALNHGWPKLMKFSEKSGSFAPWFPLPSTVSYSLAVFAELVCAVLVVVGLGTRVSCVPLVFTMLVAAFGAHGDNVLGDGERALVFAAAFFGLALTGPGKYSLDAMLFRSRA
jgi:putative oxidoreductase